jgi:aspartate kinase
VVKSARKLNEITYDEMLDLATLGAGVLHNRSVEMAKKYGVQLVVRSSLNKSEGTVVKEEVKMEKMLVSGVAVDKNVARIAVIGLADQPGVAFKLFNHLANHNINVDVIIQSVGRDGTKDITFTVTADDVDEAVEIVKRHGEGSLKCQSIDVEENVAKVSIVGAGMMSNPGVAAKMFEALYDENINIKMISTSEIRVTVIVDLKDAERAANAAHDKFQLGAE